MNLQTKFNFLLFTAILFTAVPLIILGTLTIKDIVYDLNRQLLNKELEDIHSRVKETYRIVEKQGKMSLEESMPNARVKLDDWLGQQTFGEKSHVYVIAADHTIIIWPSLDTKYQVPKLEEMKDGKRGEFNYVFHGDDRFCMYNTFEEGNWLIAVSIDKKEMFGKQGQYFWLASLAALALVATTVFIGYRFNRNITTRLKDTLSCIKSIEAGNYAIRLPEPVSNDEIGMLQRGVNYMASTTETRTREHQDADRALRESEAKYRTLFETTGAATFISKDDTTFGLTNSEFRRIFGYSEEELEGRSWTEFIHKDDLERLKEYHSVRRIDPNAAPRSYELRVIDAQGNIRNLLANIAIIPRIKESIGSLVDITELKRIEGALRESEKRYRFLFNNINDLISVMRLTKEGLPGEHIEVNDTACRNLGYTKEEFSRLSIRDVEDIERQDGISLRREMLLADSHILFETVLVSKDGRKVPVEVNTHLVDFQDQPAILTCARDMTQRKRSEEALLSERDKLQGVLNAIGEGLYIVNRDYVIQYQNRVLSESFSHDKGRKCYNTFFKSNEPCEFCRMREVLESGRMRGIEAPSVEGRDYDIVFSPYTDVDGNANAIVLFRDITENRRLKAEAMQISHLTSLGELAAGVAHEINNPINGIISYAEILEDMYNEQNKDAEIPRRIIKEGDRIAQIVRKLLSFARDRKDEYSLAYVQDILFDALDLVKRQVLKDGIRLNIDIPPGLPGIKARSQEIQQVFLNIISNARYALNEGFPGPHEDKTLVIRGETMEIEDQNYVRVIFHDTGTGIRENSLERISDPFYSTKPKGEGTGLGLSISHGIIKNHGGRLWFESKEGEYTRVNIDLPVDNGREVSPVVS